MFSKHWKTSERKYDVAVERTVRIRMSDGVELSADIFRPKADGKFPAIVSYHPYDQAAQTGPIFPKSIALVPRLHPDQEKGNGSLEAGDPNFYVRRGYVHAIVNIRGTGLSDGLYHFPAPPEAQDGHEVIEWIARQPWCDGNVGMIGISAFGGAQFHAAVQQPPHLRAIFPYDSMGAYGEWHFRDFYPGGVLHTMLYLLEPLSVVHHNLGIPGPLPPDVERKWQEAMKNPDYLMYPNIFNVVVMKGQLHPLYFATLIDPFDTEEIVKETEARFEKINIPVYTGAGWYAYTYKLHLQGSQQWYQNIKAPKKLLFTGPAHLERPFHSFHDEILRWYDHWLKGKDTGVMNEPPVKIWVMGANEWRYGDDWPLPETQWTKLYLHSWERLRREPFTPSSRDASPEPDSFVQMPPTQTNTIQRLRYMTAPLAEDTLVIGPIALYLFASIDQDDTNWIVILKDVGPDVSVRTAREGEHDVPADLPERELTRGWLKASHRAVDPKRSKPWRPWHPLTRKAWAPVVPGEINEYAIEILSTANLFRKGHRICLDITCLDLPTGTAGATSVEYIPYHICGSKTVVHKVYHNEQYPSHLLLPVIPTGERSG